MPLSSLLNHSPRDYSWRVGRREGTYLGPLALSSLEITPLIQGHSSSCGSPSPTRARVPRPWRASRHALGGASGSRDSLFTPRLSHGFLEHVVTSDWAPQKHRHPHPLFLGYFVLFRISILMLPINVQYPIVPYIVTPVARGCLCVFAHPSPTDTCLSLRATSLCSCYVTVLPPAGPRAPGGSIHRGG